MTDVSERIKRYESLEISAPTLIHFKVNPVILFAAHQTFNSNIYGHISLITSVTTLVSEEELWL